MPKAVRKTKGSVRVDKGNPLSALAMESGRGCEPSAAGRVWAGMNSHSHSSRGGLGDCMGREVTECPLDEEMSGTEAMGCVGQTVLLQDQARLRRLASNASVLGVAAQPWEPCRGHQRGSDLLQSVAVLHEDSDLQKGCHHLFQNINLLHEDSDYRKTCDHLFQNDNLLCEDLNLQVCPNQNGCQDVRVTWALPVVDEWGVSVPCNVLPKRRNHTTPPNARSAACASINTAHYNQMCMEASQLSWKQKHIGKHFEGKANTPPKLLKEYPPFTSSSSIRQRVRGEAPMMGNIDNCPNAAVLEETSTVMHFQGRVNTPLKLLKECPSFSGYSSIKQGVSGEAAVMDNKDKCPGVVMLEETPTMMLSIHKVQPTQIQATRYAVHQQVSSHQQGQHSQNLCTDAKEVRHCKGRNSSDESSPSQVATLQSTFVCLADQTYSITPSEVNYIVDSALPPLTPLREILFDEKFILHEEDGNMPQNRSSLGISSSRVSGGPSLLPMSTPCTVPFTAISSDYLGDKDAMFLLQNSASDSFLGAEEARTRTSSNLLFSQNGVMPERSLANGLFFSSQDTKVSNKRQEVTQPAHVQGVRGSGECLVSTGKSVFSITHVPQLHSGIAAAAVSHSLNSQVVWTAQDPKFSVPSFIALEREDKGCHMNPQSGDRWRGFKSLRCLTTIESTQPCNNEDSASFARDINFSARMMDEYKSKETHKSASNEVMHAGNARDSVWFSDGRGTLNTGTNRTILGEYPTDAKSFNSRLYCTTDSQVQALVETRPVLGEGNSLTVPSTLSDLMIDSGEEVDTDTYTQPDQACKVLPHYEFSGVDENDVAEDKAQGSSVDIGNISVKKPQFEDNMNISDFNDLLDSLLDDIESEKVVNCAAEIADSAANDTVKPTTSSTEETREERPFEKSTEYIVKDISRSGYNMDVKKGECFSRPLLLQVVEKDLGKDVALLVPVNSLSHLHETNPNTQQTNCLTSNANTCAKIPQTVSFRTVPSGSGCGIFHLTTQGTQIKPTFVSCLSKGRQTETKGEVVRYARQLAKNASYCCGEKKVELPSKYPASVMQPVCQNVACSNVNENTKLTLPIGETGISIKIPKYASVNVKSFLSSGSPKLSSSYAKPVSSKQWWPEFSNSSLMRITPSLPVTAAALKIRRSPQINSKFQQHSEKKLLPSQTATTVVSTSPQRDLIKLQSSMSSVLMTPVSNESSVPCVVPQGDFTHNSSKPSVSCQGNLINKKTTTQYCLRSTAHPHVSTCETVKLVAQPETSPPFCPLTKKEQPAIIQIKSYTKSSTDTSMGTRKTRTCKQENLNKTAENLQREILRKKSYPDSYESRNVLKEDLKELLPQFSESVLSMLHLPPKAIHRGYFSVSELKTLHTQALGIHQDILYRDHVSSCTHGDCPTCLSFRKRGALTWEERELQNYSNKNKEGTVRKQPRGKKREGNWKYETEDEDDLYFWSPFPSSKGEFIKSKENHLGAHCKRARGSSKKESIQKSPFLRKAWGGGRVKRSVSDTDLLHLSEKETAKEDRNCSFDDSCLIVHPTLQGTSTSHGHRLSSTPQSSITSQCHRLSSKPSRRKESPFRREMTPRTKSHMYTLRNDQWASVCRTTAANLRLKKELERDCVPYTEQQNTGESRASCWRPLPEPLIIDIISITVGTLSAVAEEEPLSWPRLHVNFSERKLTYTFSVMRQTLNADKWDMSQGTNGESEETSVMKQDNPEPTSCVQDKATAHAFFVVDVPFTSLRALSITSNSLLVLLDTLPGTCLMAWGEKCWTSLPWSHPVSLACHARLTQFRALLALSPIHQLVLQHGKDQVLLESLSQFSPWFKQTLTRPFPILNDLAPSWALPFPTIPADLSSVTHITSSPLLPPSSSSLSSISSLSSFLSTTSEDAVPQCTASSTLLVVSSPCSAASIPESTLSSALQGGTQYVQKPEDRVYTEQTTNPKLSNAGPITASPAPSSEPYIVSAVREVLQAQGLMHVLPTSLPLQYPPNLCLEKGCSCKGICRTRECPCARAGVLCHPQQSCCCKKCANPFNVLHVMGCDVHSACLDECLVQNLYNYNVGGLCSVLVSRVRLPCCGASTELLQVIPGTVMCSWCGAPISYSWCSHYVHLQTLCPRSHCMECCRCKPVMNTHCQRCHQCTKTTLEGQCGECGSHKV